jgi:phosphoglycolate phosphatase
MKVLCFDLDGTLFDTRQDIADAVNHARREFQLPEFSVPQVTSMVGHGISALAERAFRDSDVDPLLAREGILNYYSLNPTEKAKPYPGVHETIPILDYFLAVVSNKRKLLVDALLEKHGLTQYFDFVAGGDTFKEKKPDPEAIHFLLQRYQVTRAEILVIGDHSPDIEMAKRAGVQSVFCRYGFFGVDRVGADFQIDAFPELLPLLDRIA